MLLIRLDEKVGIVNWVFSAAENELFGFSVSVFGFLRLLLFPRSLGDAAIPKG